MWRASSSSPAPSARGKPARPGLPSLLPRWRGREAEWSACRAARSAMSVEKPPPVQYHLFHNSWHQLLPDEYTLDSCMVSCLLAPHKPCAVLSITDSRSFGLGFLNTPDALWLCR